MEGVSGTRGVLVNRQLARELEVAQQAHEQRILELKNLEKRYEGVWETRELLDDARVMGYVERGERVYYFADPEGRLLPAAPSEAPAGEVGTKQEEVSPDTSFKGLGRLLNILIAFLTVLSLHVAIRFVHHRRKKSFACKVRRGG
jgi:hypothetical protein